MKKLLLVLIIILFISGSALAQDLIVEKNRKKFLFLQEILRFIKRKPGWLSFNPGKIFIPGKKPFSVQEEEVFIQVEGGELVSLISDSSNESTKIIIVAEEQTKGKFI